MKHTLLSRHTLLALLAGLLLITSPTQAQHLPKLSVSENGHDLQTSDGQPFFYQGDTAWELFHRLTREEADLYLRDRAEKGYNVIQAVALAELEGIDTENAYGHLPLINRNPAQPATKDGEQNDYWDNVDYIISRANSLGLYVGLLPTWGRWWRDENPIFNEQNADAYGRWIAERYSRYNIIWILGGDRNPDSEELKNIIDAMARGILSVDKEHLITFHPTGWQTSSLWFHNHEWLDFNGRQSGHTQRYNSNQQIASDFNRSPSKPIIELEPLYEDHPLEFKPDEDGHSNAWDVRRGLYWSVFYGSAGVTYGHHSVWQMYDIKKGREPINRPMMAWHEAIHQPAADQVQYLKQLMLSRPYFSRIPTEEFIIASDVESAMPGAGRYRFVATIDSEGSYAMVYAPISRPFAVRGQMLKAEKIVAWWFSPRTAQTIKIGTLRNQPSLTFTPPSNGEAEDWVLVLDDAAKHYPAPSKRYKH